MIAQALDLARGIMSVPHLIRQTTELEAENHRLREQLTGRVDALETAVADASALARELYAGPIPPPSTYAGRQGRTS